VPSVYFIHQGGLLLVVFETRRHITVRDIGRPGAGIRDPPVLKLRSLATGTTGKTKIALVNVDCPMGDAVDKRLLLV